jgi:Cys-rich protein (TIGR01571 family)
VYSKNRQRLRSLRNQGTPLPGGGVRYDGHCWIYASGVSEIIGYSLVMQVCWDVHKMICIIVKGYAPLTLYLGIADAGPFQIHTRERVRERYGIRGDSTEDCATSWYCRPCALTQERREIELEEGSFQVKSSDND